MKSKLPLFNDLPKVPAGMVGQRTGPFSRLQLFEFRMMQGGSISGLIAQPGGLPLIVCDGSAFRRENPDFAHDLLARYEVWVAPAVVPELLRLRDDPTATALNSIIFDGDTLNARIKVINLPPDLAPAAAQYVSLLRYRKHLLTLETARFVTKNGRPPNDGELAQLRASLRTLGPRVSQLATKFGPTGKDEGTDEWTVVMALILALLHDKDATVLTDDLDLHEQLYKFASLLRDHFAASLLADDYLAHPERYGKRISLADHPDLDPFLNRKDESFVVTRPENLDYLFPRSEHPTRAVSVARVRQSAEFFTWIASKQMLSFLRRRSQTGRNTSALGPNLDAHIFALRVHDSGTLPPAHYAFFLDEHRHEVSGTIGDTTIQTSVGRTDILRAAVDSEHFDPRHTNKLLYESAVTLQRRQQPELADQLARELLRRSNKPENSVSALGLSQTLMAIASIAKDSNKERAISSYDRIITEFGSATKLELVAAVAQARINKGQLLFNMGRTKEALAECDAVEKKHVGSPNPHLARCALLAGSNRVQCYVVQKDWIRAAEASVALLIRIGLPPQDFDLYNIAVFSACKYLYETKEYQRVLGRASEVVDVAKRTYRVENQVTLLTTLGHVTRMTRMQPPWLWRRLYDLLRDTVATTTVPLLHFEDIGRSCARQRRHRLSMEAIFAAPDRAFPMLEANARTTREGARSDLFVAHVLAASSDIAVRATLFARLRDKYQGALDIDVRAVGLEAGRLARICHDEVAVGLGTRRRKTPRRNHLEVTALAPDGRVIKLIGNDERR